MVKKDETIHTNMFSVSDKITIRPGSAITGTSFDGEKEICAFYIVSQNIIDNINHHIDQ